MSCIYYSKSTNQWRAKINGSVIAYGVSNNGKYAKELAILSAKTGLKYNNYYTFDEQFAYIHLYTKKLGYHDVKINKEKYDIVKIHRWYIRSQAKQLYCEATINGQKIKLHKLITGTGKDEIIDHIDRNGLNNSLENLRITTTSINGRNSMGYSTNSTGFTGVSYSPVSNKVYAYWQDNGKQITVTYNADTYGYDYCINKAIVDRYTHAILYNYRFSEEEIKKYNTAKEYVENIV